MPRRFAVAPVAMMMLCALTYKSQDNSIYFTEADLPRQKGFRNFRSMMWLPLMKAVLAQTETTAQRMQLRALVIGPLLLARIHMHAKLTAEHANM